MTTASPRGLITNREIDMPAEGLAAELFTAERQVIDRMKVYNEIAKSIIESSGENPSGYRALAERAVLDPAHAAARVMKLLGMIEGRRRQILAQGDMLHRTGPAGA